VADARASTPTAAAETVAPSSEEVSARFRSVGDLLARGLRHAAQRAARRLAALETRPVLADPRTLLLAPAQRIDSAAAGLARALPIRVARERERLTLARRELPRAASTASARQQDRVRLLAARLEDLSPLGILARGYAVCYDESGRRVVRSAGDVSAGDRVRVRLHQGVAGCLVESVDAEGGR
jgi:exodeoxyribonuclease VII large subunit